MIHLSMELKGSEHDVLNDLAAMIQAIRLGGDDPYPTINTGRASVIRLPDIKPRFTLTPAEREDAYRRAMEELSLQYVKRKPRLSVCDELLTYARSLYAQREDNRLEWQGDRWFAELFPEFAEQAPAEFSVHGLPVFGAFWWYEWELEPRLKALEAAIALTPKTPVI
jgi:hypothetical protein